MAELMMAMGIFVLGGGIAYPLLVGDVSLYARNFSLNKSHNSLRYSLQMLKNDIDMAIEPPMLVSYRVSGTTGILKALPAATVSAQGILMYVNLGPAYDMQPTAGTGTGGPIAPAGDIKLTRHIYSATDPVPTSPMPQIGDRLIIMSPAPLATGMPETVSMDGVTVSKPGRRITSVNGVTSGIVPDNGSATITIRIDLSTTALPSPINGDKSVYIARETAYVVNTVNDAGGNPVEGQLLRFATTANMTVPQPLIRDLDPVPQEIDATTNAVIQPFNYYTGRGTLSPLSINLPVRALDYANAVASRNVAAGTTNVSSEFNVFLRSNPQMGVKVRLD